MRIGKDAGMNGCLIGCFKSVRAAVDSVSKIVDSMLHEECGDCKLVNLN